MNTKLRIFALLLTAAMLFSLAACGSSSESTETETEEEEEVTEEDTEAEEETAEEETAEEAEEDSEEAEDSDAETDSDDTAEEADAEETATSSVIYPIEGDYTFTMTSVTRLNVSEALGDDDYSVTMGYAALQEATGITIEFEMYSETVYLETLNLRLASQDYPDMFSQTIGSYDSKVQSAIEEEIIIDLQDYLEYAPDWAAILESDEDYYNGIVNGDGSIGKIVNRTVGKITQMGLLRGDWLDELGLDSPTTIDELTEVLRAFHETYDTANTLLINSDLSSAAAYGFNFSGSGFDMVSMQLTEPDSDELICSLATESFMEYLEYLASLYAEGLITDDFLSISKENGNWESAYYGSETGVWMDDCKYCDTAYAAFAEDESWVAEAFVLSGEDYHMNSTSNVGITFVAISTACEYPEIAMQFLNYGFTETGRQLVAYGIEGETYTVDDDGNISYTDLILDNEEGYSYDQATVLYLVSNWMPYDAEERSLTITYTEPAIVAINLWTDEGGDDSMMLPAGFSLSSDEEIEISTLSSDPLTHLSSIAPAVVVGQATIDDYRAAVEEAYAMGLEEITEIYQNAYDSYLAGLET